jgi:hypothetical protein
MVLRRGATGFDRADASKFSLDDRIETRRRGDRKGLRGEKIDPLSSGKWDFPLKRYQTLQTQRFSLRTSRLGVSLKSFLMRQPCRI